VRFVIRADGGQQIGGGHVMRCLTLAGEAVRRGHDVQFIVAAGPMAEKVRDAGFVVSDLPATPHTPEAQPPYARWLSAPWATDAKFCARIVSEAKPDWLVWDHYGLDARWVDVVKAAWVELRVLAMDDLDDRDLGSDLALDPARLESSTRVHPVPAVLDGPQFALLRPEFAALRHAALARRGGAVRRVLILPGMMDAAGLAKMALRALEGTGLEAEVVMGSASQSLDAVRAMVVHNSDWTLTLDAEDIAQRMVDADLCIGAGGGTSWERCCMGLPTVAVAVTDNQELGIAVLAKAGAVLPPRSIRAGDLAEKVTEAIDRLSDLSTKAAKLCDGRGAERVLDAVEARLRLLTAADAQLIFDWRNQPIIRATSHSQEPLDWDCHTAWFTKSLCQEGKFWRVYQEGGRDLGAVMVADQGGDVWKWSFYIGATDAPRGAGSRMLSMALAALRMQTTALILEGEVLAGNVASTKLHERLGFKQVASEMEGVLVFHRQICDQKTVQTRHDL
jgi:UDP-2,4-diacetamido-2,4,6-trideoxy-beta-L-altropyranose hydrolase